MQVRAWLTRSHEFSASEVGALAAGALERVEAEFGRDAHSFVATITPSPEDVLIEVAFETSTLTQRQVDARMPLINPDVDLGFDRVEFGWDE